MSEVEQFWYALSKKWYGKEVPWGELEPQHQHLFIEAINVIFGLLHFYNKGKNG